jgi:hypothetical protein
MDIGLKATSHKVISGAGTLKGPLRTKRVWRCFKPSYGHVESQWHLETNIPCRLSLNDSLAQPDVLSHYMLGHQNAGQLNSKHNYQPYCLPHFVTVRTTGGNLVNCMKEAGRCSQLTWNFFFSGWNASSFPWFPWTDERLIRFELRAKDLKNKASQKKPSISCVRVHVKQLALLAEHPHWWRVPWGHVHAAIRNSTRWMARVGYNDAS